MSELIFRTFAERNEWNEEGITSRFKDWIICLSAEVSPLKFHAKIKRDSKVNA